MAGERITGGAQCGSRDDDAASVSGAGALSSAPFRGEKILCGWRDRFRFNFFRTPEDADSSRIRIRTTVRQTAELLTADQVAVYPIGARRCGDSYLQGGADPEREPDGKAGRRR